MPASIRSTISAIQLNAASRSGNQPLVRQLESHWCGDGRSGWNSVGGSNGGSAEARAAASALRNKESASGNSGSGSKYPSRPICSNAASHSSSVRGPVASMEGVGTRASR
jgi:hypothetical protein